MTDPTHLPMLVPAADHYWSTLVRHDGEAAYDVVRRMLDVGVPVADALQGIVVHTQQRIGDSWAANEWSVAQEHAATAISEDVVARLCDDLPWPGQDRPSVLVACAEREQHSLAALVVTACLRSWGYRAEFAGPDGPDSDPDLLQQQAERARPAAVLISASLSSSLTRVAHLVASAARTGVPVVVGGAAVDSGGLRARALGATYAASPAAARDLLDRLPDVVIPQPVTIHDEALRLEQVGDVLARQVLDRVVGPLEAHLAPDHWSVVLTTYAPHLVGSVAGGVLTADPTVPALARDWLADVLLRRGAPEGLADAVWAGLREELVDYPTSRALVV